MKNGGKKLTKNFWIYSLATVVVLSSFFLIVFGSNQRSADTEKIHLETVIEDVHFDLGHGLAVTQVGSYSGVYMEDASDESVSDVMMIMVENNGDYPLQYAEITLSGEDEEALFKLSTLEVGQTAIVLEAERKKYTSKDKYTAATVQYDVFFSEALNTYGDILKIQPLEGGFNITNISNQDITGEIVVYFKDCVDGMLYGGITYRGRIAGGLKAGEIKQVMSDNFSETNTEVMFITIGEE